MSIFYFNLNGMIIIKKFLLKIRKVIRVHDLFEQTSIVHELFTNINGR